MNPITKNEPFLLNPIFPEIELQTLKEFTSIYHIISSILEDGSLNKEKKNICLNKFKKRYFKILSEYDFEVKNLFLASMICPSRSLIEVKIKIERLIEPQISDAFSVFSNELMERIYDFVTLTDLSHFSQTCQKNQKHVVKFIDLRCEKFLNYHSKASFENIPSSNIDFRKVVLNFSKITIQNMTKIRFYEIFEKIKNLTPIDFFQIFSIKKNYTFLSENDLDLILQIFHDLKPVDNNTLDEKTIAISRSALFRATLFSHLKLLQFLVKLGADLVKMEDGNLNHPIHIASFYGKLNIVKYLLEEGVNPDLLGADQVTPLSLAISNGHKSIVELLIQYGADIMRIRN